MTWAIFREDGFTRAVGELLMEAAKPSGSERVVAIVGGTLLEETVERTLRHRLIDNKTVRGLFKPDSPLGNVTPQIDMLFALGAFDDQTRKALKGIAGVRNFFAHRTKASFDSLDKDFEQSMKRLILHEGRTHYPHHLWGPDSKTPIEDISTRKDQFIVNLKLGLIALMRDRVSHHRNSNIPRTEEEMLAKWSDRFADEANPDG